MKLGFMFPGQGAQFIGMGKDLADNYKVAKDIFKEADEALDFSITKMCFEGPEEDLKLTYNTQPALLTVSIAAHEVLKEKGFEAAFTAGHSLGEYSSLVIAGSISFSDAVRVVRKRGQFMQEAVPVGEGAMAAIIGFDDDKIIEICSSISKEDYIVEAVNFNCPGQVVIAGSINAVSEAVERIKEAGAKRAIMLPVSAPFHSSLMKPAAVKLGAELSQIKFEDAKIPVFSNVTGKAVQNKDEIKDLLVQQAANPVLWTSLVKNMSDENPDAFIEIGPGRTLCGFSKKIVSSIPSYNVGDIDSLEKTISNLKEI